MLLVILWIVIYLFLLTKNKSIVILYAPSLFILVKISSQILTLQKYNEADILLNYLSIFFIIYLSLSIIFKNKSKIKSYGLLKAIFIFILFLFILILITSSDVWLSFKRGLNITTSLLLFLAIYLNRFSLQFFKIGIYQVIIYLLLFALNGLFFTVLKIGPSINEFYYMKGYSASFLRLGNFGFFELHGVAILTGLTFLYLKIPFPRKIKFIIIIISLVNIVIIYFTYKRTFLAIVISEVLLFYVLNTISSSRKLINAVTAIISIAVLYILFGGYISAFIKHRAQVNTKYAIENTGRVLEFTLYPEVVKYRNNPTEFVLFGTETFNSAGKFKVLNSKIQGGDDRFLHNDYSHLLYGTGVIGLLLYIYILILLYRKSFSFIQTFSNNQLIKNYSIASLIIISGIMISGLGDGILALHNRVVPFYAIGLFLSFLNNYKKYVR